MKPDYLVLGDITRDLLPDGRSMAGGTTLYAATTAAKLGKQTAIFTSGDPGNRPDLPESVEISYVPSETIATFENRYTAAGRTQLLHALGAQLRLEDLPPDWRSAPIVHLGPLTGELPPELVGAFPDALVGVTPQGWMRAWDAPLPAAVRRIAWHPDPAILRQIDALIFSIEDVGGDEALAASYALHCKLVAVTRGANGSTLYIDGAPHQVSAYSAVERDPTGAGDVFAAALLVRLKETGDPLAAAAFASAVAACAVEAPGIGAIPQREAALARM